MTVKWKMQDNHIVLFVINDRDEILNPADDDAAWELLEKYAEDNNLTNTDYFIRCS